MIKFCKIKLVKAIPGDETTPEQTGDYFRRKTNHLFHFPIFRSRHNVCIILITETRNNLCKLHDALDIMTTSSLKDIKKELSTLGPEMIQDACLRLAKFRKENKELLTYLLFEAHDEQSYCQNVKETIKDLFATLPQGNSYWIKKTLRKILRFANRQIKYSGVKQTEVEIRICFCAHVKEARIPMPSGTVLFNLYQRQLLKIKNALTRLPEDLQSDYESEIAQLS